MRFLTQVFIYIGAVSCGINRRDDDSSQPETDDPVTVHFIRHARSHWNAATVLSQGKSMAANKLNAGGEASLLDAKLT